jgi:hypothetical protein
MKRVALMILIAATLAAPTTADASVHVSWRTTSVDCWQYRVQEHRTGVLHINDLWRLTQTIRWCGNNPPVTQIYSGPTRKWTHWENLTWNWGGLVQETAHKLTSPTRWVFYVKAAFNGNGAYLLTEHNYPWIRMTIFKANPTHVLYHASCGC